MGHKTADKFRETKSCPYLLQEKRMGVFNVDRENLGTLVPEAF